MGMGRANAPISAQGGQEALGALGALEAQGGQEAQRAPGGQVDQGGQGVASSQPYIPQGQEAYFRAENEDDDGYDPYSDRRTEDPLFERDPWR